MRKLLSLILIFVTYWMSTWLVTDIHGLLPERRDHNQPHPIFSLDSSEFETTFQSNETADPNTSDCRVCSYDHGGHFGQMLAAAEPSILFDSIEVEGNFLYPFTWISLNSPPKLRPPIA